MKIKFFETMKPHLNKALAVTSKAIAEHGPKAFLAVGISTGIAAAVVGAVKTLKLEETLQPIKQEINVIRDEDAPNKATQLIKVYLKGALEVGKLYWLPLTLGATSVACILTSHGILNNQKVSYAAAFSAVNNTLTEYRERVKAKYGEEAENDIFTGAKTEVIESATDVNGKTKKTKEKVKVSGDALGPYARYFSQTETKYAKLNDDYNELFLKSQEAIANVEFESHKFITLNDVLKKLGYKKTVEGQYVGWLWDPTKSDNYVSFNYRKVDRLNEFGNVEKVFLLEFNVDGMIVDRAQQLGIIETKF